MLINFRKIALKCSDFFRSIDRLRVSKKMGLILLVFSIALAGCESDATGPDPVVDVDTDGDGIFDAEEDMDGTSKNNPCDPKPASGYTGYDPDNIVWLGADCDTDGITNGDELAAATDPYEVEVVELVYAKAEFLPTLSELQIFKGNPSDLIVNNATTEYSLSTQLYSDYSQKFRTISLPEGAQMTYNGEGLLEFPDNTVISKTFYYFNDERDPAQGKKLIETRLLIKKNGVWSMGNYLWNEGQTEAVFSADAPSVAVDWIDAAGAARSVDYKVPFTVNCTQCHNVNDVTRPIGPKARNLNFVYNGKNQLKNFVEKGLLVDAPEISQLQALPDWEDADISLEARTRAYMDVNCAHCHQPGGNHDANMGTRPDFRFGTSFADSQIFTFKEDIVTRVTTTPGFGPAMPQVGTTQNHTEGVALIQEYIDSLEQ